MDRYRINYVFLAVLVVGGLICAGALYFLREFQVTRNAGEVLARAERAQTEGNLREAITWYSRYRRIVPEDTDTLFKLTDSYAELLEVEDVRREEALAALGFFEDTLQRNPGDDAELARRLGELRRQVIDIYMSPRFRSDAPALNHLVILLREAPEDPELLALEARCLVRTGDFSGAIEKSNDLIGYDPASDTFDLARAKAPSDPDVYRNLANVLRTQRNSPELADRVMDQLVAANPNSHDAHLFRSQYYVSLGQPEKASGDVRRAFELAPDDADAIVSLAMKLTAEEQYDEAVQLAEKGKALYPTDERFYRTLADIEFQRSNNDAALAYVEEGLQAVSERDKVFLLIFKADLQFRIEDLEGVQETMQTMKSLGFRQEYIDHVEARIKLVQGEWHQAVQILRRIRPLLARNQTMHTQVAFQLGVAHEQLGQLELALEAYEMVLRGAPEELGSNLHKQYELAATRRQLVLAQLNRTPQTPAQNASFQSIYQAELDKPEEERDWDLVMRAWDQYAQANELPESRRNLLLADIRMRQRRFADSRALLNKAVIEEPDNISAYLLGVSVTAMDPDQGPAAAIAFLENKVAAKFGDLPALRQVKADLLIQAGGEQLEQQLMQLTEGMESWTTEQQIAVWNMVALRMLQRGFRDRALECWNKVAELKPNDLNTRVMLFTLAYDANDDAGMAGAQEKILEIVGSKNDSTWLYSEARRLLSLHRRQRIGTEALNQANDLVDQAAVERPDWHELHLLRAEIALMKGDRAAALRHFEKAAQLGSPYPTAIAQHAQLLVERGEFAAARRLVERIPAQMRQALLGGIYAEILFQTGDVEQSLQSAGQVIQGSPDAANNQLWYSRMMSRTARSGGLSEEEARQADQAAGEALRRAVELAPQNPEAWLQLITYHARHKDTAAAEEAMQQMQLAISSEYLPILLAKSYELLGRGLEAENLYLAAHRTSAHSVPTARQLAEYYLGSGSQAPDSAAKARRYLNEILRAGTEGRAAAGDANLLWARRTAAQLLARTGEYQNLIKAKNLIMSNAQDGQLAVEDRLLTAQILASQPEPVSRREAIRLLEEVKRSDQLNLTAELELGRLYYATGNWNAAQDQMLAVIDRFPNELAPRVAYVGMLLDRGEAGTRRASLRIDELDQLAPGHADTVRLKVLFLKKNQREQEAQQYLKQFLPPESEWTKATAQQLSNFERIAELLAEVNDLQTAEKIYTSLAERDPLKAFRLAEHVGIQGDVEKSFRQLDQVHRVELTPRTVRSALHVLRQRRDDVGEQYDPRLDAWFEEGLRQDPESMPLLIQKAEFRDMQGQYDEAIEIYLRLLARQDLTGVPRAVVLNNVSYLIALGQSQDRHGVDPLQLVEEAIQIWGPRADILDTRAVILTARQQYERAIEDLELSVSDGPSSAKYFHKAVAHLLAGQNSAAIAAWEKAIELGLTRESVNRMERGRFDEMKTKIEGLTAQRANLTQALPATARTQGAAFATSGN